MDTWDYEWKSEFAINHIHLGKVMATRRALEMFLRKRGIGVTDDADYRIMGCTDLKQLERWIERAAAINSIDELFAPTDHAGSGANLR